MTFRQRQHNIKNSTPDLELSQQTVAHGMTGVGEWNSEQLQMDDDHNLATQNVIEGIQSDLSPLRIMDSINVVNRQLGNRAFLKFVGELHERRRPTDAHGIASKDTQGRGQPLTSLNTGQPLLHRMAGCSVTSSGALQLMPKKKKRSGKAASEKASETASEASVTAAPQPVVTPLELESGEKKTKKSKVQVALNILRKDGTDSFKRYVDQEITVTDSLITLRRRIQRAEDLNKNHEAVEVVDERMRVVERREEGEESVVIADVRTEFSVREQRIFKSCVSGDLRMLKQHIKIQGIDINMSNKSGTPLCYAASNGRVGIVRELLSVPGIAVNLAEESGATPLSFAALNRHVEVVKLLLGVTGINVNPRALLDMTPLHFAVQNDDVETVKLLLAAPKIKIDVRDSEGDTPLLMAFRRNYPGIFKLLIERGANVNLLYGDFTPLLCVAVHRGDIEMVRILLNAPDIQINLFTTDGRTALYLAARLGSKEIVELLLDNGSDPDITDNEGVAPLHLACSYRDIEIVRILLNAGADVNAVTSADKYTPHGIAQIRGAEGIMALLEASRQAIPAAAVATQPVEVTPASSDKTESNGQGVSKTAEDESVSGIDLPLTPSGAQSSVKEAPSSLSIAKNELIQEILRKLERDSLEPLEGIRIMADLRVVDSMEKVCEIYNRLARIERQRERAKRRGVWYKLTTVREDEMIRDAKASYALDKKLNLDADIVESEIKKYLEQSQHRFVSQAVNDMELGRGKPVSRYPGMLHASAGITGVGSCTVFYYTKPEKQEIRIVGIGHHLDRETYRLRFSAEELSDCGNVLRLT